MIPQEIREEIISLSKPGASFKPHKYIALLTAIRILHNRKDGSPKIYFNEEFKEVFSSIFNIFASNHDRNRPYTPFFHLRSSSFWRLHPVPGKEFELSTATTIGGPGILADLVEYAEFDKDFCELVNNHESFIYIESLITRCIKLGTDEQSTTLENNENFTDLQKLKIYPSVSSAPNPFVSYLNSLQRLNASNENALAESQACSEFFTNIQVPHPLTDRILDELRKPNGCHVILTGHAGDGKSTIALEVYKRLLNHPADKPLSGYLKTRENLPDAKVSIIKDLSEWSLNRYEELADEIVSNELKFLLVSNTGTLLNFFRSQAEKYNQSEVSLESELLSAISSEEGGVIWQFYGISFLVINLARIDNLAIAMKVFTRMLSQERWNKCKENSCKDNCPIYNNVKLIFSNQKLITKRLFLAYRRMYEYGTRLTLRQLTEHLAYMLTSGLEYSDIESMGRSQNAHLIAEYLFFNRFFGDNGKSLHRPALQFKAVAEIRKQGFGERLCPTWERKLWLKTHGQNFDLQVSDCDEVFNSLREYGSRHSKDAQFELKPDEAREQVRRILYFLYDFQHNEQSFLTHFLNSPSILRWQEWQKPGETLDVTERAQQEQRIYHVLQEHFTGVRLPEGAHGQDRRLYITLSHRKNEIRQSAQVVLAQIDWSSELELRLIPRRNVIGTLRIDLQLHGKGQIEGTSLVLTLPFLDYVVMRHYGEIGEVLQAAYVGRLNAFKSQLLKNLKNSRQDIMLVRLKTDHTFRRQYFAVSNGVLEVADVF